MTEPAVTGTMVLRQTVKARNKSPHALSLIARELGISASTLEDFAAGTVDLDVETLKALTPVLHPFSEYDAELDLLRSANRAEPTPGGIPPSPYEATPKTYKVGMMQGLGPQPALPLPPTKPKRTGWLNRWI